MDATLRDLYTDAALRRVLTLKAGETPTEQQRTRLSQLILRRYQTRVSAAESLNTIIVNYNDQEDKTASLRNKSLAIFSDDALVHWHHRTAAAGETPAEALHTMEKKIISAVKKAADEIGQMCEDNPAHLKETKSLLEEVRSAKASSSWLKRAAAEGAEEVLERAIKYGSDAEDDHAIKPDSGDKADDAGKEPKKGKSKKASILRTAHGTGVAAKGVKAKRMIRRAYSEIESLVAQAGHTPDEVMKLERGNAALGPAVKFTTGHRLIPVKVGSTLRCELYENDNEVCAGELRECAQVVIEALTPRSKAANVVANLLRKHGRDDLL